MTFPLLFEVYKPKQRLLESNLYQTKPEIAASMIKNLRQKGFKFKLVLADSLYGEQRVGRLCRLEATANPEGESESNFVSILCQLELNFVVAIRSNHGIWLPQGQKVRHNRWRPYNRIFSDGTQEKRYIREIVFGKRRDTQYWQVTTDPDC